MDGQQALVPPSDANPQLEVARYWEKCPCEIVIHSVNLPPPLLLPAILDGQGILRAPRISEQH